MNTVAAFLQSTEMFSGLDTETIRREIVPCGQIQDYKKGCTLLRPQHKPEKLGFVMSGKLQIIHIFADGSYSLASTLSSGEMLGTDLVFTRTMLSPHHVITAADTQLFYLPASLFTSGEALCQDMRQHCMERLLMLVSHENMKKEYRLAILSRNGLRERIISYLSMQANRLNRSSFSAPFFIEEMASFLCVNRRVLSHELSKMQMEGILSFSKNSFTLYHWEPDTP